MPEVGLAPDGCVCAQADGCPLAADVGAAYAKTKIGVLLLNLGGPDDLDAVEPFLYNLFSDPEIITLPSSLGWLNGPIAKIISKTRAPTSREGYAAIGGGSPQLDTTIKQGQALEAADAQASRHPRPRSHPLAG